MSFTAADISGVPAFPEFPALPALVLLPSLLFPPIIVERQEDSGEESAAIKHTETANTLIFLNFIIAPRFFPLPQRE